MGVQQVVRSGVKPVALAAAWVLGTLISTGAMANVVVNFNTSLGSFDVSLDDASAPVTVANFMSYLQSGAYEGSVVHRSVPGFVIQGGGFYDNFAGVVSQAPIVNETKLPNVRGTIAMARTADLNSATSQWFINTADNATLDTTKYAVFGQVLGDGMKVVDAIAALPIYNLSNFAGGAFGEVPLRNVGNATVFQPEFFVKVSVSAVPEPQSWALMAMGTLAVCAAARARRQA
jgi:cyclophilin family peptidyl-prolyl cis-trans isomerase